MSDIRHNISREDQVRAFELSKLMALKKDQASAMGSYRSRLSQAEAKGMHTKAAKDAIKIYEKGDVTDTLKYLEELTRNLRILGMPLKSEQLEMFDVAPAVQPLDEKAHEQGMGAGILGMNQDENPHDLSTDAGQAWMAGWHEGCEARAELQREEEAQADDDDTEQDQAA